MTKQLRITHYALLVFILLAFGLRVWRLPQTPPGLWYDEAYYVMDAAYLLDGGPWRLFFAGNNGREPLFIYLQALFIWLFGATPLAARLAAPLLGTLTVPLVYVLARRLGREFGPSFRPVAWVATATFAISFWHLGLSRGGYRGILLPLVATFLFYAFWRGWRTRSLGWVAWAGVALGIAQYTYLAARALPLVIGGFAVVWTVVALLRKRAKSQTGRTRLQSPVNQSTSQPISQSPNLQPTSQPVNQSPNLQSTDQPVSQSPVTQSTSQPVNQPTNLAFLWLTLAIMALLSALIFAPLGRLFYQNPALFSARTGDVFFTPDSPTELVSHLSQAVRLFIDGGDPNWRHHLPGRPMLGWLGWLGFWPGLLLCLRRRRRPAALFLLIALLMLYLPALLSVPPVHALRLSALLPIYAVIFALGLVWLARWVMPSPRPSPRGRGRKASPPKGGIEGGRKIAHLPQRDRVGVRVLILLTVLLLETGLTTYDYFGRWAVAEETYVEYNTPLVEFVEHVAGLTREGPVILPFQIYVHPTTRYLLHDQFEERPAPADLGGPARLVTLPDNFRMLNVANIPELPAYVWLARGIDGRGVAYVSRPPRRVEQDFLRETVQTGEPQPYLDRFGRTLARFHRLDDPAPLLPMFTAPQPLRPANITWGDEARLVGYEVVPQVAAPNQPITLNLYWQSLTNRTFDHRLFLQVVDSGGNPINQWEGEAFREDMYRWRPDGILPTQHRLWLGPETPPGPYLIRLGYFDRHSGQRLLLRDESGVTADQTHLGLFYVTPDGAAGPDPRQPATPRNATFDGQIELTGATLPDSLTSQSTGQPINQLTNLPITLHWQTIRPTPTPQTVFLQLLDDSGQVVTSWDSQPLNGLYPTSRWSPGEVVVDTFRLPLPDGGLPPGDYRLITGFYQFDTFQRLPVTTGGDFAEVAVFTAE